jgi:prepilin-type N-terminal cleavage/methylation domain-containing protein
MKAHPRSARPRRRAFSLIEVLVAITILALAMGATLTLIANAQMDLVRTRERHTNQHAVSQALEYCLLVSPDDMGIPEGFLPEGYTARCTLESVVDGLPEHAVEPNRGWQLGAYVVEVFDPSGIRVGYEVVYKMVPEGYF